jgi:hypothetical protein
MTVPMSQNLAMAIDQALERMRASTFDPSWPVRVAREMKAVSEGIHGSLGFPKFADDVYQSACQMLSEGLELREVLQAALQSGLHLGLKSSAEHYERGRIEAIPLDGPVQ